MNRGSYCGFCSLVAVLIVIPCAVVGIYFEEYNGQEDQNAYSLELEELIRSRRALPSKNNSQDAGEPCFGYNSQKGRCLPLENCVLQPLKENYIKYKAYYCIRPQSQVGVCCPNTIAIPDVYNENTYQRQTSRTSSNGRRRSSRAALLNEHQEQFLRHKRALPPKNSSQVNDGTPCNGHNSQKGRCLSMEKCVLQPLKENYIKYKAYYCIDQQSNVGVCCPNTISSPEVYSQNTFQRTQSVSATRRSTRHLASKGIIDNEEKEQKVMLARTKRAIITPFTGEKCYGQKYQKGRCLELENCVLQSLKEDYIKNRDYYCIFEKRKVGVCCPNTITKPQIYDPNTFYSKSRKRIPKDVGRKVSKYLSGEIEDNKVKEKDNPDETEFPDTNEVMKDLKELERKEVVEEKDDPKEEDESVEGDSMPEWPKKEENSNRKRRSSLYTNEISKVTNKACYGYRGEKGRCLPLEKCVIQPLKENYIKYKDYYCIYAKGQAGVCCPNAFSIPDIYNETKFQKGIVSKTAVELTRSKRNIGDEVTVCGRNGRLLSQVLKNQPVENKAWPWAATIINADTKEHHCGGTLVSRYHILSAAHCFYYGGAYVLKDRILARLGEYDFRKENDSRFNDYSVANIIIHEDYDEPIHENDIALIILERPARYNIYVQPACMPAAGEMYDNMMAVVVGWGKIEFAGKSSSVLREVQVPVWEHSQCANSYTQTVFTTNVCAAAFEGGKDACQGDSGGPLVVQREDGRWKLIGIVSWGIQCAVKGKPGIYTQVNKYLDWIEEKTSG